MAFVDSTQSQSDLRGHPGVKYSILAMKSFAATKNNNNNQNSKSFNNNNSKTTMKTLKRSCLGSACRTQGLRGHMGRFPYLLSDEPMLQGPKQPIAAEKAEKRFGACPTYIILG